MDTGQVVTEIKAKTVLCFKIRSYIWKITNILRTSKTAFFAYLIELLAIILSSRLDTIRHKAQREIHGASASYVLFFL